MTWVKVCGLTSYEAVAAAIDGGADAIGLVLAPGSPREITVERATALASNVTVATFIVTVGLRPGETLALAEQVGATGIQAHGDWALDVAAEAAEAGYLSLVPVPVDKDGPTFPVSEVPETSIPLFDTSFRSLHGGTGIAFDWSLVSDPGRPFILAGGLGTENVARAISMVRPFGVDASSNLESEPGIKDLSRIVDFIREAKQA